MYNLILLSLIVALSNDEAERSFSVQNWIKTKLRSHLTIEHLDQLIRVSYNQKPISEFDFKAALEQYMLKPHRWY